ncbi:MAG: sigma-70 family RNA polymerase sigma factor [Lachnospiraceae bacterium]|nr:sigma-70 family RNA polymerase sigma factor [Lachnospiraceae bacterium]
MDETAVLIARLQAGDKRAREALIEKNLGLVHHIVKRFVGRGVEAEDLFQIGSIGLMKAIDKFDLSFDVRLSTYAVPLISGEIKRYLRDDGMVKVSRSLKENGWKVNRAKEQYKREKGRDITLQEIVQKTGLSEEEIVMAMEANIHVESIYKSVYQSDGSEIYLVDQVVAAGRGGLGTEAGGGRHFTVSDTAEDKEKEELLNHMLLEQLLEDLAEADRRLIRMRYFENMTQVQVAGILGISQVQVSRTEKKILQGMRKNLE